MSADILAEFDGSVCPACHHRAHDPGGCSECPRCELHTDEAAAFVLRYEPELLETARPRLDVKRLADAIVVSFRAVAQEHWPFLKGDGWPAYDEDAVTQVLVVNEIARRLAHEYAAIGSEGKEKG